MRPFWANLDFLYSGLVCVLVLIGRHLLLLLHHLLRLVACGRRYRGVLYVAFRQAQPDSRYLDRSSPPLALRNGGHHFQTRSRMLTLGIPSNPTMALMIDALMIQGIAPGPQVMTERPELFWGLIASMWIGNLMLLVLNLPLVGLWIKLLAVPYRLLFPAIFVFCCIGAYTVDNKVFDVYEIAALSAVGYVLLKLDCEPAPMVLGYILGPMMEENLRRAMMISFGDPMVLITRPISAAFLFAAVALLVAIALPALRAKREEAMQE